MNANTRTTELLEELRALEAELHHPGVRCSRERLEALLHPEFREIGRSGREYTRAAVIEHLVDAAWPTAIEADSYAVHTLAPGSALLTYRSLHRAPDGSSVDAALRASIWMCTARGWQLLYHQGTPAPA